ncbi:MAG: hypothetical protein H6Q70_4691 [Firmicutes bacterium]|nr:hypothetical protein [Bacillota bacterium]
MIDLKCKSIFCLILLVIVGGINVAAAKTTYDLSAGDRKDKLNFNIAGDINGQNPNVFSELKWTNLKTYEIRLNGKSDINDRAFLEGSVGYGWIHSGHNQDSDYATDNRTGMFSRSENNAGNGHVVDGSIGYGYYIDKRTNSNTAFVAGYSVSKQALRITDGNQTYSDFYYQTQPIGPFSGLNSTFDTRWKGPYIGLSYEKQASKKLNFFTRFEYHFINYYAEGNWNLSSAYAHPKSIEQSASGYGTVFSVGTEYQMDKEWALKAKLNFSRFKSKDGVHKAFAADGNIYEMRLNEANWNSRVINLSLTKNF